MTPEVQDYLDKANENLSDARRIMGLPLPKAAARAAYYAAFHAAEALIIERTGKIAKTHSGVRAEFSRLLHGMPDVGRELLSFLGRAYKYKEMGDYGVGSGVVITDAEADTLIHGADHFVARVTAMLG